MRKAILLISLFFFLAFSIQFTSLTYGADNGTDINLTSFPAALADKLSISEFAGGIIASLILTLAFMLPIVIWAKTLLPALFVGILCIGSSIAMGWLDYWFLLLIGMLVALMFGSKMSQIITGGRGEG